MFFFLALVLPNCHRSAYWAFVGLPYTIGLSKLLASTIHSDSNSARFFVSEAEQDCQSP